MRIFVITGVILFLFGSMYGQAIDIGNQVLSTQDASIQKYYELEVDMDAVRAQLKNAPPLGSELPGRQIQLPTADGQWHTFELWEAPIMMEGLAKRFPMIKNLKGRAIDNPRLGIRLNYGPRGLFAVMHDDKDKSYIQTPGLYADKHRLYFSKHTRSNWTCDVDDTNLAPDGEPAHSPKSNNCTVLGDQLFTYRIVVATTGEFWRLHDTSSPYTDTAIVLNALTNRLADMLIPYERDLSMTFQLVDSNEIVMYNDPSTDPFSNPTNTGVSLDEVEIDIEANFDPAHYDIGHGYHEIICGGGCGWAGLAGTPVACRDAFKASAWTYQPNDIATNTVFSHEFGHQLGCLHCNYGCSSSGCHRVEPGQGVTIMSTSANCSNADDYGDRVDFFHARSIDAILEYTLNGNFNSGSSCTASQVSGWNQCVVQSSTGNGIPTSDANPNALNLTIPKNTPFFLEGSASDPDSDPWTANWVDYNSDPDMTSIPDDAHDIPTAPLFRWFQPNTDVIRYFPQLSSILNGNVTTGTGEVLPSVGRTMDFRFIVRDNATDYGALACDELTITVDGNSGPFEVTSQNAGATWDSGNTETITWTVNNTDQAPISAANVDILFSSDGGQNFSVTLASDVPNDGSHDITVPTVNTMEGRIKVQPAGGYIFFDINNGDINVSDDCQADGQQIFPSTLLQAEEGDPELILDMDYGSIVSSISDVINSGDPNYNRATEGQTMGTCESFVGTPNHKTYDFKVTSSGSYSFTENQGSFPVMNLYDIEFISNAVCDNWLASNTIYDGSQFIWTVPDIVSSSLTANEPYELTVNDFNGSGVLYTISISGPGDVYFPGSPLVGFDYEYVVVDDLTGNIDLISASPDLTSFDVGDYTVYGLSYDDMVNVQTYVGGSFTTLENETLNGTICADLSSNSRDIEIQQLMPLDFLSFQATLVKGGAQLDWQIADPINVSHFEVDRWGPEDSDFEYLATVDFLDGKANYELLDPNIQQGADFLYRIRSVDFDGFTLVSPVRRIRTTAEKQLFTVFPNPSRQFFNLDGPVQQIQQLRVTNALGQSVLDTREPQSRISAQNWAPGLYELQITTPDQSQRIRLIVQ